MTRRHPDSPAHRPAPHLRRPPAAGQSWPRPWVQLKYFSSHPNFFPNMIAGAHADTGDIATVYDRDGDPFGHGFYNPSARVPLRIFRHGAEPLPADHFERALDNAVRLRLEVLRLPDTTDAFRAVHSDADGLPGLMADKFGEVLSVQISTLAAWRRIERWLPALHAGLGTTRTVLAFDDRAADAERVSPAEVAGLRSRLSSGPDSMRIRENGVRFLVSFEDGHKTGFFCDQRDNRARFARRSRGARVLDVCCYTGGFAIAARAAGATEATGVDLDEKAVEVAKTNANLNQQRVSFVHADAFTWMRQMQRNGETWTAVALDPPKLIHSRDGIAEGRAKYHDLNKLALSLVAPGGLFATFSCSGLMPVEEFEELVIGLAHRNGRKLQILERTGAGPDHPVMSHCPESRYLKGLWARVW